MSSPSPITAVLVISNLEYGGAQRQVVELTNNTDPRRMRIVLVSLSDYVPLAKELKDPKTLDIITKRFKFDVTVVPRLAALLRRIKPDVVQSYLFDADIAVRLAGRMAHVPLVLGSERNTDYYLKPRQLAAYRVTKGMVDLIVANSSAGARFNSRVLGYPESMYRVIHNGVDTKKFHPEPMAPIREELGLSLKTPVVGMFGSFKEQKNHPLFFEAARLVVERFPDVRLLLVGDQLYGGMHGSDQYKDRIQKLIDDSGLRPHCVMLGNRQDVARLYPACDVTVLPSLFEGTPNVALESMACGVPVVITDVSDNAYVVPDGRAGSVVPLGDPAVLADRINVILGDPARRRVLADGARAWVEAEFSTARLAEKTEMVFREAFAASRANRRAA